MDAVHGLRQGIQIEREAVVGRRLLGDLEAGQGGRARVGHPFDAPDLALLVTERGPGHDRPSGRYADLKTDLGERWFCPRTSSAVIALSPCVASCAARRAAYRCGRIAGIRSWNVRPLAGVPRAVICQPAPARCTFAMIWAVYWPPPASV